MVEVPETMKQRYTQSKRSRNLSLPAIARLTDEQAFALLKQIRFADTLGVPYCPTCIERRRIRWRAWDRRWMCAPCRKTFSLFSGTVWDHNRNALPQLLLIIANFVTSPIGEAAIQIARKSASDPSSAYRALMKIKAALKLEVQHELLSGIVEVDGCYVGGYKREVNNRKLQNYLRRTGKWKKPAKKVVCVAVEPRGRTLSEVCEQEPDFIEFLKNHVSPGSKIHTDSGGSWEPLGAFFDLNMVNHSVQYWTEEASTQNAEAAFRRLRQAENRRVHISGDYLELYAAENDFRNTYRRHSDAEKFLKVLSICFRQPIIRQFRTKQRRSEK